MDGDRLQSLTRPGAGPEVAVPAPAMKWRTRVLVPTAVLGVTVALLGYTGRRWLGGATDVRVLPVVMKAEAAQPGAPGGPAPAAPGGAAVVQAPGWIEPDPFAINVSALADGIVREVLVLEGERVEAGQVVARLIDEDAKLALAQMEGELAAARAALESAKADLLAARTNWENPVERTRALAVAEGALAEAGADLALHEAGTKLEEAKLAEVRNDHERLAKTTSLGAGAEGELSRAELRLKIQERTLEESMTHRSVVLAQIRQREAEVTAAREAVRLLVEEKRALAAGAAAVTQAEAHVRQDEAKLAEARLRLERMEVKAPVAGTVLARLAEPGSRMMAASDAMQSTVVVRLYDPAKLQVRVDIPLSEAAKVGVGQRAEVTCEALPDTVFRGVVTRRVDEANIQKNTVQVKVSIENPSPVLRPEMLARVRFFGGGAAPPGGSTSAGSGGAGRLLVHRSGLVHAAGGQAHAWVVDRSRDAAVMRTVRFGGESVDGWVEVLDGLRAGDRVIVGGVDRLSEGRRVRVVGEADDAGGRTDHEGGHP